MRASSTTSDRLRALAGAWLAACALHSGAAEHQHGGAMKAPREELGASAVFDAKGTLWSVVKAGEHVLLRGSADLGKHWSEPVKVNAQPEPIAAEGEARPKLAAGPGGELYVSWTKPLAKPYTGEIRFARSLDGGAHFDAPLTVHADRQEITHRFDALAVGVNGRVFVAWIDKRDLEAAKKRNVAYRGAAVYVARSDDRGASFGGDLKLAEHSCECCRIGLVPQADGGLLALWRHVFEPDIRDHALARLDAQGRAGELRRATFDDWHVDACPHHGPSLAQDAAGALHAVWFSGAAQRGGAFYGRLRDGGVDGARRLPEGAEHADLAVAGQRVALAWKRFDGQRTRLDASLSEDGGATWRDIELAGTEGPSDQPRMLVRDGRFYVFWNTRNEPLRVLALTQP